MKTQIQSYPFTLKDVGELMELKLSIWSDRLEAKLSRKIDQSATGIIAEMDKRFGEVNERFLQVDKRFDRVDERLDELMDQFKSLDERLIIQSERLKKVERPFTFATV